MTLRMKRTLYVLVSLLAALALLIGAYFLITGLSPDDPSDTGDTSVLRYPPKEGEDQTANRLFPPIYYEGTNQNATDIKVRIENEDGIFGVLKTKDDATLYFFQGGEDGEEYTYLPPIASIDPSFDYTSLYATEDMGLGIGLPRVMYMMVAAGNIYFTERIPLAEDATERATQLRNYGLDDTDNVVTIFFVDMDGNKREHRLTIGKTTVGHTGYYVLVDDRPDVYVSSTDSIGYLLEPFSYYVSPTLISPGTTNQTNSQYEGFLTVLFREFINEVRETGSVSAGSTVLLRGAYKAKETEAYGPDSMMEFDLATLVGDEIYDRLSRLLTGQTVGATELYFTAPNKAAADRQLSFTDAAAHTYAYTVLGVEAVLGTSERTYGTVGAEAELVKLRYTVSKDGGAAETMYGVLDLGSPLLSTDTVSALRALPVGGTLAVGEQVSFSVTYTEQIGAATSLSLVIDDIVAVYSRSGQPAAAVEEDSVVYCRYHYVISGESTATMFGIFDLKTEGPEMDRLRAALLGKSAAVGVNITAFTQTEVYEVMYGYSEYRFDEILSYVESEELVAFGYEHFRDRDPFYAETYFSNKLPRENVHSLYGLNDLACQSVIRVLGGIQSDSGMAAGMFGTETVAIGLTPQSMRAYDLYDNRICIEWPRGIDNWTPEGSDQPEFSWEYTLPFTLYISDVKYDAETGEAFRYVGSDLYDVIVRVEADRLSFIDHSFTDYWARSAMYGVALDSLESIKVTTNLDNFAGEYLFTAEQRNVTNSDGSKYLWLRFGVTASEGFACAPLAEYLASVGKGAGDHVYLNAIYDSALGESGAVYGKHYAGDGNFRDLYELLLYTSYEGTLTPEEQDAYTNGPMLLSLSFKLTSKATSYTYEFYRGSERCVMVRLYQVDGGGVPTTDAVQEFYISSSSFKQIGGGLLSLLSGEYVREDAAP